MLYTELLINIFSFIYIKHKTSIIRINVCEIQQNKFWHVILKLSNNENYISMVKLQDKLQ